MAYDPSLFAGTAAWYRYRAPYAPAALEHVRAAFDLDGAQRVLDLGCGPGTLAIPLAAHAAEVLAMDPDAGMIAQGARLAAAAGRRNIVWRQAGSEELGPGLGRFHLAVMGQSFHWMDRDEVLRRLFAMLDDGGGLALVNPGRRRPQEAWEPIIDEVVARYLGPPADHPQRNPEKPNEPALIRSAIEIVEDVEFPGTIERDIASVMGAVWSMSFSRREMFAGRLAEFEAEAREALLRAEPSGIFRAKLQTGVVIARKPRAP